MSKKRFHDYRGADILVRYEPRRCIHAEKCIHGLPPVFDRDRRPWIDPDRSPAATVREVVMRCPTGALRFESLDGGPGEPEPPANTATVAAHGPLYVQGRLELQLSGGEMRSEHRAALCRCGASQNKPFCDNRHREVGFRDVGRLGAAMLAPAERVEAEATLSLAWVRNGPAVLSGPIEIRSADGTESHQGVKCALCRCGASQNKPYCDGSHAAAGFEAD